MKLLQLFESHSWTTPVVLYRGSQRGIADPFKDTKLGFPTFTSVPTIAGGYTFFDGAGKVFAYKVTLRNPCVIGEDGDPDVVTEANTVQKLFRLTDAEMVTLIHNGPVKFGWAMDDRPGPDIPPDVIIKTLHTPFEAVEEPITINAYEIAAHPAIQKRALALGYDSFIMRGPYTGHDMGTIPETPHYDGVIATEWMVLNPACVQLIREVQAEA